MSLHKEWQVDSRMTQHLDACRQAGPSEFGSWDPQGEKWFSQVALWLVHARCGTWGPLVNTNVVKRFQLCLIIGKPVEMGWPRAGEGKQRAGLGVTRSGPKSSQEWRLWNYSNGVARASCCLLKIISEPTLGICLQSPHLTSESRRLWCSTLSFTK